MAETLGSDYLGPRVSFAEYQWAEEFLADSANFQPSADELLMAAENTIDLWKAGARIEEPVQVLGHDVRSADPDPGTIAEVMDILGEDDDDDYPEPFPESRLTERKRE